MASSLRTIVFIMIHTSSFSEIGKFGSERVFSSPGEQWHVKNLIRSRSALIITFLLAVSVGQLSTSLMEGEAAVKTRTPVVVRNPGTIAFFSSRDGVDHIYLMRADGTGVTQLTSGPYPESSLSWSRDGTKLAFWRQQDGEAIYTMNADGSNVERLSPSPGYDIFPSWSPDGTRLVFTRIVSPPANAQALPITEIMIMNADGTNIQTILDDNTFNTEPRWSPDGSKILFMSDIGGNGVQIYTMNTDGTNLVALTNAGNNGDPAWSPDGSKIAFGSNREGGGKLDIFTMNADGSGVTQLTHFLSPGTGPGIPGGHRMGRKSPLSGILAAPINRTLTPTPKSGL